MRKKEKTFYKIFVSIRTCSTLESLKMYQQCHLRQLTRWQLQRDTQILLSKNKNKQRNRHSHKEET